ncbi:hypothetical protein HDU67_007750 [Dinochytrium kinnereticum]|nr:hypothetical protein HDU67_007750 [Dinochytrium kinnereticum]
MYLSNPPPAPSSSSVGSPILDNHRPFIMAGYSENSELDGDLEDMMTLSPTTLAITGLQSCIPSSASSPRMQNPSVSGSNRNAHDYGGKTADNLEEAISLSLSVRMTGGQKSGSPRMPNQSPRSPRSPKINSASSLRITRTARGGIGGGGAQGDMAADQQKGADIACSQVLEVGTGHLSPAAGPKAIPNVVVKKDIEASCEEEMEHNNGAEDDSANKMDGVEANGSPAVKRRGRRKNTVCNDPKDRTLDAHDSSQKPALDPQLPRTRKRRERSPSSTPSSCSTTVSEQFPTKRSSETSEVSNSTSSRKSRSDDGSSESVKRKKVDGSVHIYDAMLGSAEASKDHPNVTLAIPTSNNFSTLLLSETNPQRTLSVSSVETASSPIRPALLATQSSISDATSMEEGEERRTMGSAIPTATFMNALPVAAKPRGRPPSNGSRNSNSPSLKMIESRGTLVNLEDSEKDVDEDSLSVEILPEDDEEIRAIKKSIIVAKAEASALEQEFDNIKKSYFGLKTDEINLEESILKADNVFHPDVAEELESIRRKSRIRLKVAKRRFDESKNNADAMYNGSVHLAQDTFSDGCKRIKQELMDELYRVKFQLDAELVKQNTSTGTSYTMGPLPEWTRNIVKRRKQSGKKPVYVPPLCNGLNAFERSEDLCMIRILCGKESAPKLSLKVPAVSFNHLSSDSQSTIDEEDDVDMKD